MPKLQLRSRQVGSRDRPGARLLTHHTVNASKGIGASTAEHFAAAGASVVLNYATSKTGADAVVERITTEGGKAIAVQGGVSKPTDIARLFAETKKACGKLNILVNNAGIYEFLPLEAITPEHFHKQFDLNVDGWRYVAGFRLIWSGPNLGVREVKE